MGIGHGKRNLGMEEWGGGCFLGCGYAYSRSGEGLGLRTGWEMGLGWEIGIRIGISRTMRMKMGNERGMEVSTWRNGGEGVIGHITHACGVGSPHWGLWNEGGEMGVGI
jgi:hypothetical protein